MPVPKRRMARSKGTVLIQGGCATVIAHISNTCGREYRIRGLYSAGRRRPHERHEPGELASIYRGEIHFQAGDTIDVSYTITVA